MACFKDAMSSIIAKPLPSTVASMMRFLRRRPWRNEPLPLASDCHRSCGTQAAVPALHYQPSLLGYGEGTLLSY
jgi:hypothetical protein